MTESLIALSFLVGIVTAETQLLRKMTVSYHLLDEEDEDGPGVFLGDPWTACLPPRLDHAAPGQGRTPRAFCLLLDRAGLPPDLALEAPCN